MFPHNSTFLAIPVAVLLSGPLIMEFLTGYQRQLALHFVALHFTLQLAGEVTVKHLTLR